MAESTELSRDAVTAAGRQAIAPMTDERRQSELDGRSKEPNAIRGGFVLRGLVAGVIGAWVMDRATWMLQDREPRRAIQREREAWPIGLDVSHSLGYRLAAALGISASRDQPSTLGMFTHYLLGIGPAIIYSAL